MYLRNDDLLDVVEGLFADHDDGELETELGQTTSRVALKQNSGCIMILSLNFIKKVLLLRCSL